MPFCKLAWHQLLSQQLLLHNDRLLLPSPMMNKGVRARWMTAAPTAAMSGVRVSLTPR